MIRAVVLGAVLLFPVTLSALPEAARELLPEIERLQKEYDQSAGRLRSLQASLTPKIEEVDQLKREERRDSAWWRRWWLKRRLADLRAELVRMQESEQRWKSSRLELFNLISGVVEVVSSELEEKLRGFSASAGGEEVEALRQLLAEKETWSKRLEMLGFGDANPFELVEAPVKPGVTRLYLEDQVRVLRARQFQLEAWHSLLRRESRIYQDSARWGVLDSAAASQKIDRIEELEEAVAADIAAAQKELKRLEKRLRLAQVRSQGL